MPKMELICQIIRITLVNHKERENKQIDTTNVYFNKLNRYMASQHNGIIPPFCKVRDPGTNPDPPLNKK